MVKETSTRTVVNSNIFLLQTCGLSSDCETELTELGDVLFYTTCMHIVLFCPRNIEFLMILHNRCLCVFALSFATNLVKITIVLSVLI